MRENGIMKGEGRIQWERYEGEGCKEDKGIKDGGKEGKKAGREEKRRRGKNGFWSK